jgi:vitamin B12/bleomycin/antimicrobial peptide transport system ATP-binding/permease protein
MQNTGFLKAFWALAKPYWVSEERAKGLALLVAVVGLSLGLVYLNVQFNSWYNDFYNAIQDKKGDEAWRLVGVFTFLAFIYIAAAVYRLYLRQMLEIEWRKWLNERYLRNWLGERAYYKLQLLDRGTDNPDQRIAEDLRVFVELTLRLALGLLSAVVTLISFVTILWIISGALEIGGISIPGYMVWAALLYAIAGTWLTHVIGKPLIGLEFERQRYEADYRFSLVRLRENSEGVALYRGEKEELENFRGRFANVIANWWSIMRKQKQLGFFTTSYDQLAIIFPLVVALPRYLSGAIQLGGLMQISSAFGQVQGSLSWFIEAYTLFAQWKATVDRLTGFSASLDAVREEADQLDGERVEAAQEGLGIDGLALSLPQGRTLLQPTTIDLKRGDDVLVTGPSGAGKSTLFRALAGIWPYWKGRIRLPKGARLLFLPQKPYLPIGKLKHVVSYPDDASRHGDESVQDALDLVGLGHLATNLERNENWAQVLSGGEQQRLAFARALLTKPDWLFLDEATASLPEADQDRLYRLLKERLPGTTLVSIGHRDSLAAHHDTRLAWESGQLRQQVLAPQ